MHVAALWGNYELLKLLLANGGDLRIRAEDGRCAEQMADDEHQPYCRQLLRSWAQRILLSY